MDLGKWLKLVEQIAPLALAATPLAPIAPFVAAGVRVAEQVPGADGPTKQAIAKQIVDIGVAATNAQAGHTEIDPDVVHNLVSDGINTVVGAVNLKHASEAEDAAEVPTV